jgi:hypothetical protein
MYEVLYRQLVVEYRNLRSRVEGAAVQKLQKALESHDGSQTAAVADEPFEALIERACSALDAPKVRRGAPGPAPKAPLGPSALHSESKLNEISIRNIAPMENASSRGLEDQENLGVVQQGKELSTLSSRTLDSSHAQENGSNPILARNLESKMCMWADMVAEYEHERGTLVKEVDALRNRLSSLQQRRRSVSRSPVSAGSPATPEVSSTELMDQCPALIRAQPR